MDTILSWLPDDNKFCLSIVASVFVEESDNEIFHNYHENNTIHWQLVSSIIIIHKSDGGSATYCAPQSMLLLFVTLNRSELDKSPMYVPVNTPTG